MKTKLLLLVFVAFCFKAHAQLSGDYTVGTAGSDYPTITSAVSDAVTSGINGPITFNIKAGLYEEGIIQIDSIPGASKTNTVTFTSEDLNADSVIISNDDGVFLLVDAAWVHFEKLSFESSSYKKGAITFNGSSHGLQVIGNKLDIGYTANGIYRVEKNDGGKAASDTIIISNNTIIGGLSAIYIANENEVYSQYIEISNNSITGFGENGIYIECFGRIYNEQGNHTGLGGAKITANKIQSRPTGVAAIGIALTKVLSNLEVSSNELIIIGKTYLYGIYQSNNKGTESNPFKWFNNFVYVNNIGAGHVTCGILNANGAYNEYSNNTVIVDSKYGNSSVCYYSNEGDGITNHNNVYVNLGNAEDDLLVWSRDTKDLRDIISASDFNVYYGAGDNFAIWKGEYLTSLEVYKDSLGLDANSVFEAKGGFYKDGEEYNYCSEFSITGTPLDYVTEDLYGNSRDATNPKIGAIEYISSSQPLNTLTANKTSSCGSSLSGVVASSESFELGSFNWSMDDIDLETETTSKPQYINETSYITLDWSMLDCEFKDSIKISINETPSIEITGDDSFCSGDTTWLKVTSDQQLSSINWSTGSTKDSIDIFTESSVDVEIEAGNGCTNSTTIQITEISAPTPTITQSETDTLSLSETANNYAWYVDNILVPESDFQSITTTTDGTYTATVTYANGCIKMTEGFDVVTSSLEDLLTNGTASLYPNPVSDILYLDFKFSVNYKITTSNGETVTQGTENRIDVSSLENGIYFISISNEDNYLGSTKITVL